MVEGNEPLPFDWSTLVPRLVHPMKVAIIEALAYVGQPLSATDFSKVFGEQFDVPFISYHVVELAKAEAIVKVQELEVRGAIKKSYFFPAAK